MPKNIAAYTAPSGSYPPYISVNEVEGLVEVTVRSPVGSDGSCGPTAYIRLTPAEFDTIIMECQSRGR